MSDLEWKEENRLSWNAATKQHNSHKGDQAAFFRGGGSTLFAEEIELLGDVEGKSLLHLQCNAGQDSLSIASQLGAEVTGVDISDEAVKFAQHLSEESNIPATFVRSDIYDWFENNEKTFDVVFCSYGTVIWLSDLDSWAQGVAAALKPGGRFVIVDFHPMLGVLDGIMYDDWSEACDYMGGAHYHFEYGVGDYVGDGGGATTQTGLPVESKPFENPHPANEFAWGIGEIVMALVNAGLRLATLNEYDHINGFKPYSQLEELPERRFTFAVDMPVIPLMYGIVAEREVIDSE